MQFLNHWEAICVIFCLQVDQNKKQNKTEHHFLTITGSI